MVGFIAGSRPCTESVGICFSRTRDLVSRLRLGTRSLGALKACTNLYLGGVKVADRRRWQSAGRRRLQQKS